MWTIGRSTAPRKEQGRSTLTLEAALREAWGREPSRLELERLKRVRDAFGVDDNDAFMTIAAVLEFYDSIFRQYPDAAGRAVEKAAHQCLRRAQAAGALGNSFDATRRELSGVTLGGFAAVVIIVVASLGMAVGASIQARSALPCWAPSRPGFWTTLAGIVLGAPAGWLILIVVVVPALYAAQWGWQFARAAGSSGLERLVGGGALALVGLGLLAWVLLLQHVGP